MMLGNSILKRFIAPTIAKPQFSSFFVFSQRNFCYRWMHKHRDHFYPTIWNTPDKRRGASLRMSKIKYKTQDPLFLDPKLKKLEGGITPFITRIHDEKVYNVPLRNIAFVLYHAAKEKISDPILYKRFEDQYSSLRSTKIQSREAYGGLWGCYTSGNASPAGIKFWEGQVEKLAYGLNSREICDLIEAHNLNGKLDPENLKSQINNNYKKRLLEIWDTQVLYNQRVMMTLITEFLKLKYYDEELLKKLVWIQNLEFFSKFHNAFHEINDNPKTTLYKKLDKDIQDFESKFSTRDFKWRYSVKDKRIRTHKELVARREDAKREDFRVTLTTDERSEAERQKIDKEQQLKNAVYNEDLFIQVVQRMMNEGKSTIEMMVYLDVKEEDIINAQSIISKNEQIKKLEELRKNNQLPFQKERPDPKAEMMKKPAAAAGAGAGGAHPPKDAKKDDKKAKKK